MRAQVFLCFVVAIAVGASGGSARQSPSIADTAVASGHDTTIYEEQDVDTTAAMLPGSPSPVYPAQLRERGIGGSVVLRFVVDEMGQPDANHVQLIRSPDPSFTSAVYRSLYYAKFRPAIRQGKTVRQWVQMQFDFKVTSR
jgi:TonB family protein